MTLRQDCWALVFEPPVYISFGRGISGLMWYFVLHFIFVCLFSLPRGSEGGNLARVHTEVAEESEIASTLSVTLRADWEICGTRQMPAKAGEPRRVTEPSCPRGDASSVPTAESGWHLLCEWDTRVTF